MLKILNTRFWVAFSVAALLAWAPSSYALTAKQKQKQKSKVVAVAKKKHKRVYKSIPARPSFGKLAGLHSAANDQLTLKSSVAYVIDQDTQEILLSKNGQVVLPIASITKLMTALVVREANLDMDEMITITTEDVDTEKGSTSRLRPGTSLTRGELLHLALMSSENRAAHALGRSYPAGLDAFINQMNAKAAQLGMRDTRYAEPTGLSSLNQSSAKDLATLVALAANDPTLTWQPWWLLRRMTRLCVSCPRPAVFKLKWVTKP